MFSRCDPIVLIWRLISGGMATRQYNQIKRVLKQKKRTGKWLAGELGVDETTVSRWCRNIRQPSFKTLFEIAELLDVEPGELLSKRDDLEG